MHRTDKTAGTKGILAAVAMATLWLVGPAHAQATVPNIGGRLELFVDRYLIQTLDNAKLKMHKPADKGIVFLSDMPWEGNRSAAYNIVNDGDRYRCYYKGAHFEKIENLNTPELPWRTCVRISSDGITWEAPSLGLTNFSGSTDNSLLPVDPALSPENIYVNANPNAPAQDRFLGMVNIGITSNGVQHLQWYVSASPDGLHFTMKPALIKVVPNCDGGHVVFWDSNLGQYVAYTRIWYNPTTGERGGWDVRDRGGLRWVERSVSADLTTWSAPLLLKFKDALGADAPAEHIYTFEPSFYFRAPHLQIMLVPRDVVGRSLLGWEIGPREPCVAEGMLMSSRDGLNWDRTFMEAVIRPGLDLGNWVWKTMWPVGGFIQTSPTEISAYTYEHMGWGTRATGNTRVRRWAWRLDGFASVNAGSTAGEMITKPFVFSGSRLVLNYSTAAAGSIRVEIQDTNGVPVTGYALADSPERYGDEIEGVMRWKNGSDLGALAGTPIRLRFVLKDADLYSIRFANPSNLQYTVTYNANGATSGSAPAAQTKEHDVALTLALSGRGLGETTFLKKTGYIFAGWNTATNGSGTDYAEWSGYTNNASMTLHAKWTPVPASYAVTFNRNGATSGWGPAAQTKTHDVAMKLPSPITLARPGFTFTGWNTAANGGGTNYAAGATYTDNAAVTLYAKWTAVADTRTPGVRGASAKEKGETR